MRLIDADPLFDKAEEKYKNSSGFYRPIYSGFLDDIADAKTVDAVLVVRCKDCKHWCDYFDSCDKKDITMHEDDFCSYGERRTDG